MLMIRASFPGDSRASLCRLGAEPSKVSAMTFAVDAKIIERKRKAAQRSREIGDQHHYFQGVAQARYVLRKVFRLVEEQVKKTGLDPLAHQALIQIYGSPDMELQVNQVAERLDISPAFASNLIKPLVEQGHVTRTRGVGSDQRVTQVKVTKKGVALLQHVDSQVQVHVDYFTRQLTPQQRENALSILVFYVGASLAPPDPKLN
jgi:DNA-binding MarR family transcriptional regulator